MSAEREVLLEREWHSKEDYGWFASKLTVFRQDDVLKVTTEAGYAEPSESCTFRLAEMIEDTSEIPPSGEVEYAALAGVDYHDRDILVKDWGFKLED